MSAALRLVAGLVALVGAALLLVLAGDVRRWEARLAADDTRYRVRPDSDLWDVPERLPFRLARRLLEIEDDLAYRRGVRLYRLSRPRDPFVSQNEEITRQGEAQAVMMTVSEADPDPKRRSRAENLLGVLSFVFAGRDPALASSFINSGLSHFQRAIRLDPSNVDAKYNLEFVLNITQSPIDPQQSGADGRGRARGSASAGDDDSGY